jgi:hypothetical protein
LLFWAAAGHRNVRLPATSQNQNKHGMRHSTETYGIIFEIFLSQKNNFSQQKGKWWWDMREKCSISDVITYGLAHAGLC